VSYQSVAVHYYTRLVVCVSVNDHVTQTYTPCK